MFFQFQKNIIILMEMDKKMIIFLRKKINRLSLNQLKIIRNICIIFDILLIINIFFILQKENSFEKSEEIVIEKDSLIKNLNTNFKKLKNKKDIKIKEQILKICKDENIEIVSENKIKVFNLKDYFNYIKNKDLREIVNLKIDKKNKKITKIIVKNL